MSNPSDIILARMMSLHPKIIDLTLDRVWRLLEALGHPERHLPPVIHIAGTNGKGSTQAMLRAGLEATGAAVHAYTSPHLARFHERIRLAGRLQQSPNACAKSFMNHVALYHQIFINKVRWVGIIGMNPANFCRRQNHNIRAYGLHEIAHVRLTC